MKVAAKPLPRSFYARDTMEVARGLLGKVVVRRVRGKLRMARIVETEAYHGLDDAASHSHGGPTPRSRIMFGPAGYAYVYLIYGMWNCLNIVTGPVDFPSAVLLRAGEITSDPRAGAGPGKLCQALGVDRKQNGLDLTLGKELWVTDDGEPTGKVCAGERIGVAYAGEWATRPWRFWINGHPSVSKLPRSKS